QGQLLDMNWRPVNSSCVVLAAPGYPEKVKNGGIIEGNIKYETPSSYFLHAGTLLKENSEWVTNGGRVLNAIGLGSSLKESLKMAYSQASKVSWEGLQMRSDIGKKLLSQEPQQ
ncbi:MAG: hypothetical protein KDD58_15015, partial [Bdellovibrionales bacterium]|nr:hypothetical protein [Bdellovibrionales bacterium]